MSDSMPFINPGWTQMNTDLIVRFIQNIRVHLCPSVVYKYTNLVYSTLGSVAGSQIKRA